VLFAGQRYDVNDMYLAMLADTLAARSANRRWPVDLAAGLANLRIACQVRSDSPAA
jgi:hypothetical protein